MSYTLCNRPTIYIVGPHKDNNICLYHSAAQFKDSIEEVLNDLGYPDHRFGAIENDL